MNIFRSEKKVLLYSLISAIPVVALCILIFCMSAEKGSVSDKTSGTVVAFLPDWLIIKLSELFDSEIDFILAVSDKIIRKLAHFCEFGLLSVLCFIHFNFYARKKAVFLSAAFSILYAISDEIHQLFVEGRSAQVSDVLIDSSGAIIGSVVCFLIYYLIKRHSEKILKKNIEIISENNV